MKITFYFEAGLFFPAPVGLGRACLAFPVVDKFFRNTVLHSVWPGHNAMIREAEEVGMA